MDARVLTTMESLLETKQALDRAERNNIELTQRNGRQAARIVESEQRVKDLEGALQICVDWMVQAGHPDSCDQAVPHADGGIAYHDEKIPCTCDYDEVLLTALALLNPEPK